MATRFIETVDPTSDQTIAQSLTNLAAETGAQVTPVLGDADTGLLHYYDRVNATARTHVNTDQAQTISGPKTFTAPVLNAPVINNAGTGTTGVVRAAGGVITELTGDGTYTISVTVPAGAVIMDIQITAQAVWTAGTSAVLTCGDSVDVDGFVTNLDVKSAPAVGSTFSLFSEAAMGSADGAYFTTDSIVGPTTTNFGLYYAGGSVIRAAVIKSGTGTGGRTQFTVFYVIPEAVAQVVS